MFRALLLLSIALVFASCTGENNGNTTATVDADAENGESTAEISTRNLEDHESSYARLWVVKIAVEAADANDYKGRWFKLKEDGTFESGKWQETNNAGLWSIDKASNVIFFAFNEPESIPVRWEIQGNGGGGRILFKGNVPGNEKGIQVMLEPETVLPVNPQ